MNINFNSLKTQLTLVLLLMVLVPTIIIGWMTHGMMSEYIKSVRISDVGRVAAIKHEQLIMVLSRANKRAEHFLAELETQCAGNSAKLNHGCAASLIRSYLTAEGAIGANLRRIGSGDNLTIGISAVQDGESILFFAGQLAKFASMGSKSDHAYFVSVSKKPDGFQLSVTYPSTVLEHVFNPTPADLGQTGETFIADGEGYFVTSPRYASTQGHKLPISAHPMQDCLSGQSREVLDLDYRDAKIIHGYRFVPEFGSACIMAHITQKEAFAPLQLLKQRTYTAAFIFGVLIIIAIVYLAKRIVKPVIRLTEGAHAIAEGDYRFQADVEGSNELAKLAATFNHMANRLLAAQQQLAQNEAQLKLLNNGLEQRVAERTKQLAAANEELESFNYSVAHDLRSPLRGIYGFSRLLSGKYHDQLDDTGKDWLNRIARASQRMGHIIDDMLLLSRVTKSPLNPELVDLSQVAENVAGELRKSNPERQVQFILQKGLSVQADPGLLRIVMENLLGNAYKFTGKKAQAEIEFGACTDPSSPVNGSVFFVRDNGDGFNMKYSNKLFVAFQRLHAIDEFEGTGIGLATVQRVIHRHNGRVWAEATEGQGATVYFTLP